MQQLHLAMVPHTPRQKSRTRVGGRAGTTRRGEDTRDREPGAAWVKDGSGAERGSTSENKNRSQHWRRGQHGVGPTTERRGRTSLLVQSGTRPRGARMIRSRVSITARWMSSNPLREREQELRFQIPVDHHWPRSYLETVIQGT